MWLLGRDKVCLIKFNKGTVEIVRGAAKIARGTAKVARGTVKIARGPAEIARGAVKVVRRTANSACGGKEDMMEYLDLSFYGIDSKGNASYSLEENRLIGATLNLGEEVHDFPDEETRKEAEEILGAYTIEIEPQENLSNGDEVQVTIVVDKDKTKKIKGGEKKFTVEGLEAPEILTTEEIEKKLVLNFNGVNGRGVAQIDNVFDVSPLNHMNFKIENDGELKNGDQAKLLLDEDFEPILNEGGYILEEGFQPTFEVKGLAEVAEKATDIKNLEDVERFLLEELSNQYRDTDYTFGPNTVYDIEQEELMYRQFRKVAEDENVSSSLEDNGNLIGVFSVKEYSVSQDGNEREVDQFTLIFGFSRIILDEDNKANLSELNKISDRKDDNYSLESVIQLYEGEGYEKVKK